MGKPITSLALRRNFRGEPFDGLLEGLVGALEEVPRWNIFIKYYYMNMMPGLEENHSALKYEKSATQIEQGFP